MALGLTDLGNRLADAVADRPLQLVGLVLGCAAAAHFAAWTQSPGRTLDTAVATANLRAAAPEVAAYAQSHPAYVLAFVVGVALLFRPSE